MKSIGIICEFNPMHAGHGYLISELRRQGYDNIVCLMSGSYVQRGEVAVMPKGYRAEAALLAGSDLVLELPFPYCASSARYFAVAGVDILTRLGVDAIGFGSETGDIDMLKSIKVGDITDEGKPCTGIAEIIYGERGIGSNDILALEYLRACGDLQAVTVKRVGAAYNEREAEGAEYPSATAIREILLGGRMPDNIGEPYADAIRRAMDDGVCPISSGRLGVAMLSYLRLTDPEQMSGYAECGGGVSGRLINAGGLAGDYEELMLLAATKKYTNARLRRALLFAMLGVREEDLRAPAEYVCLLGSNRVGREFLASIRKSSGIRVVTKPADVPEGSRQSELLARSEALAVLAYPHPTVASEYKKFTPFVK